MRTGAIAERPARGYEPGRRPATATADVIVIGSGISGTLAAAVLAKPGFKIVLVDRHPVYPPDFRAEHLDGPMIEQLRRLGFLTGLTDGLYRGETVTLARYGRIVASAPTTNYGLRYETLVNRARAMLPAHVTQLTGRVTGLRTSDQLQQVELADGTQINGRLVVIATGQGHSVAKQVGIHRRVLREAHSLTFGFDIESTSGAPFPDSFLVYQHERIRDRIDYLAAFTMGGATRANLFTYRDYRETWTKSFLHDPSAALAQVLPNLASVLGPYRARGPVAARPIDLYVSEEYRKDGVVLIGDAFQASCPATGMGMVRVLTDIEQLATVHAPRWLATPGMAASKISAFYDDPVKRACDAKALHDSEYRRAVSTETSLGWALHRSRVQMMERMKAWRTHSPTLSNPRVNASHSETSLAAG